MSVQPSLDITDLNLAARRELDNLIPTVSRMAQWGAVTELPFTASDYFATTGTWTVARVNFRSYRYTLMNAVMTIWINLRDTTTSAGMGGALYVRLPPGYGILPDTRALGTVRWYDGAAQGPGLVDLDTAALIPHCLRLLRDSAGTAWPTGTIDVSVMATVPVYPV